MTRLRALNVGSLGGLHYELYDLSPARRSVPDVLRQTGGGAFLDLNGFFWARFLERERVSGLIEELAAALDPGTEAPDAFWAAVQAPEAFLDRVREAEQGIFDQSQTARSLYGHLETLAIVCQIHTYLHGGGFRLTIQEGYELESFSSVQLIRDCLTERRNPYLPFLEEHAWPAILAFRPEVIWLNGRLTLANMAVARFARRRLPGVKILWAGEGSEYYAANKITDYLRFNTPLFEVLDGIVLFDHENTRNRLTACMDRGDDWGGVNNLMYARRAPGRAPEIVMTPYGRYGAGGVPQAVLRTQEEPGPWRVSPAEVANVRLFPDKACFWRRCAFCGINGKYPLPLCATPEDGPWPVEAALSCLEELEGRGVRYFWSIDEAVPAETLAALARGLSDRDSKLIWQARSRISPKFLEPGVTRTLSRGGLRELRLGLESASLRVLSRMNKFGPDFSLRLVEDIAAAFQEAGVKVHFPMIVGFPLETEADRGKSYSFLTYLREKYDNVSFNVNIFALDVSSPLFADWDSYGVSGVAFPCAPRYFLGNLLRWECAEEPFDEARLSQERDRFMRDRLYPWIRPGAQITPHIFYRLLETTRGTLFQPASRQSPPQGARYRLSPGVLRLSPGGAGREGETVYYSLKTQTGLTAAGGLSPFLDFAAEPRALAELAERLRAMDWMTERGAEEILEEFLQAGLLEPVPEQRTTER